MTMEASGRVSETTAGLQLDIARSLALPLDEAWAYLVESEQTERWFGPWEGNGRAGGSVHVRMRFEEELPTIRVAILACEPERRLVLRTEDEAGGWHLEILLDADGDDDTIVRLIHHLDADAVDAVGELGPGWEFYLDLLVAATEDTEEPTFDQYYPALRQAYVAMVP